MVDCEKCRFVSVCKKRPKMPGAKIAECNTFRERLNKEKPMTNADRIRAMSDEELAEFLCGVFDDDYGGTSGKFINGTIIEEYDEDSIAEWLKQPAEE